jgi:phosphoribosylpyrophosphate synthetase
VPLNPAAAGLKNLKVLSVAPLIGEAMRRIHSNESISMMFQQFGQL